MYSQCGPAVPFEIVNLTGNPDSLWFSQSVVRNDTCCGATNPDKCVRFIVTLDSNAVGIEFGIASGAIPPGALYFQINCGPFYKVDSPICLNGPGPHEITFCKPGNNQNVYRIRSVSGPSVGPAITINDGCNGTIYAYDYDTTTVKWNSVFPGARGAYNNYLSCDTMCMTVNVSAQPGYPPFVDYEVCGLPLPYCNPGQICDTVRVYFNSTLGAFITPANPTICFGQTTTTITANGSGGTPPYDYLWSTGETTKTISVGVGTYTVTVGDTTNCPPVTATVTVTSFSVTITADAGADKTVCVTTGTVILNGSVAGASGGIWGNAGGAFSPSDTTLTNVVYTPTPQEIQNGFVNISLLTTGNGTCPPDTDTVKIIFGNFAGSTALNTTNVLCFNDSNGMAAVNTTGIHSPYTYQWSTNPVQTGSSVSGLATGTYTVTITDSLGCYFDTTLTITQPAVLTYSSTSTDVSCVNGINGTISTIASGGTFPYTYSWSPSVGTANSISNLAAGNYTVIVTDQNGCTNTVAEIITEPSLLTTSITASANPLCNGGTNGSITVNASGGTPSYQYTWQTNPVQTGNSISGLPQGSYTVYVNDNNGCLDTLVTTLTHPTPVLTLCSPDQNLCIGNSTSISATSSGGTGPYSYSWSPGIPNSDSIQIISPTTSITYTVYAIDQNNCTGNIDTVHINVYSLSSGNLTVSGTTPICPGESSLILATVTGNTGSLTYSWSHGLGSTPGTFTVTPTQVTTYVVEVTSECGTTIRDSITIAFNPPPVIVPASDTDSACSPATIRFSDFSVSGNPADTIISWLWSFGDGSTSTMQNPTHVFTIPGTYSVTLQVTTQHGCTNTNNSNPYIITVHPSPVAAFTVNKTILLLPIENLVCTNQSVGAIDYRWDFGDGQSSVLINPVHAYATVGNYRVRLIATNYFSCSDTAYIDISAITDVIFPNAFTPDPNQESDGYYSSGSLDNNIFFPYTVGVEEYHLMIFNRWGEMIFESHDVKKGWNGYFKNEVCQQGVYIYKVELKFYNGKTFSKTGDVTLIR